MLQYLGHNNENPKISTLYYHKVYFLLVPHVYHRLAKAVLQGICFLGPRMTEQHLSEYHKSYGRGKGEMATQARALRASAHI